MPWLSDLPFTVRLHEPGQDLSAIGTPIPGRDVLQAVPAHEQPKGRTVDFEEAQIVDAVFSAPRVGHADTVRTDQRVLGPLG